MSNVQHFSSRTAIALTVALAFPLSNVVADEVQDLVNPNNSNVSITIQDLNSVNPLFRYYTDQDHPGVNASVGVNVVSRSDEGLWLLLTGKNLGQNGNQELGYSYGKQGDWLFGLGYNEITKFAPYTIQTKVGGVGTDKLDINQDFRSNQGLGPDTSLSLERKDSSLSLSKAFSEHLKFNIALQLEEKTGEIMSSSYGQSVYGLTPVNTNGAVPLAGMTYAGQFFAPQPEDYRHSQLTGSLDYQTKRFQLSVGYYGSYFRNDFTALNLTPGYDHSSSPTTAMLTNTLNSAVPWISLPPSNNFSQFYAEGAYNFTDSTRASFKFTKAETDQNAQFIPNAAIATAKGAAILNPAGVAYATGITNTSLNGLIDTTTAAAKVTSRFTHDLDFAASWRFENFNDKTPNELYINTAGAAPCTASTCYYNENNSHTTYDGKLSLAYRFPEGYRVAVGDDYGVKRTPEQYSYEEQPWRDEVDENRLHLDLSKSMSESINGSISLSHAVRTGSPWLMTAPGLTGTVFPTATNVTAPLQFSDRTQDKAKVMLDWDPTNVVSLDLYAEHGKDRYTSGPMGPADPGYTLSAMGLLSGDDDMYGFDLSYIISENWKATAFYTYSKVTTHQNEEQTPRVSPYQPCTGGGSAMTIPNSLQGVTNDTCVPWTADLDMRGEVLGFGLKGKSGNWVIGGKYMYSKDWTDYNIAYTDPGVYSPVPAGAGYLPETYYTINRLQLSGTYVFSRTTQLRLDYIYDLRKMDDYTWQNWTFADGTTVTQSPSQRTQLVAVTVMQKF